MTFFPQNKTKKKKQHHYSETQLSYFNLDLSKSKRKFESLNRQQKMDQTSLMI